MFKTSLPRRYRLYRIIQKTYTMNPLMLAKGLFLMVEF